MIHSERDLFSSVAFFAKRAEQRIYVRWLPFFSLHENLIWCYSADTAKGTTGVHKANGTHRAGFIYCTDFNHSPNSPVIFVNEAVILYFAHFPLPKQLLMMSALHFRRLQHCISPAHPHCREREMSLGEGFEEVDNPTGSSINHPRVKSEQKMKKINGEIWQEAKQTKTCVLQFFSSD